MRRTVQLLVLLGAAVASFAVPYKADAVPYEVIASAGGGFAIQGAPALKVIRSQEELADLWRASGRSRVPEVDFRRHTVIGYFLSVGTGSRLVAESVEVRAGTMTVQLVESTPGECCVTPQIGDAPAILITTIPWKGPVEVQVRREARPSCCTP